MTQYIAREVWKDKNSVENKQPWMCFGTEGFRRPGVYVWDMTSFFFSFFFNSGHFNDWLDVNPPILMDSSTADRP